MALLTTTIGSYPKPPDVALPDWFNDKAGPDTVDPTGKYLAALNALGEERDEIIARGIRAAITDQVTCGIDIPTDGEIKRENYIHYHCRHINGIDFAHLTKKALRTGSYSAHLPTIVGPVSAGEPFLGADFAQAQSFTSRPLKMTLPGPMTITDTTANDYYDDPAKLGADLAQALNVEVIALAEAGCKQIQIDEPVFARTAGPALEYGVENLERAFHDCPPSVVRSVHICCGYPDRLDNHDYPKAPPDSYLQLAKALDESSVHAISIEDAHRPNDLALLELFVKSTVVFGAVAIAMSEVEPVEADSGETR